MGRSLRVALLPLPPLLLPVTRSTPLMGGANLKQPDNKQTADDELLRLDHWAGGYRVTGTTAADVRATHLAAIAHCRHTESTNTASATPPSRVV